MRGKAAFSGGIKDMAATTINGTPGDDNLPGTGGNNFIYGFAGDDTLDGKAATTSFTGGQGRRAERRHRPRLDWRAVATFRRSIRSTTAILSTGWTSCRASTATTRWWPGGDVLDDRRRRQRPDHGHRRRVLFRFHQCRLRLIGVRHQRGRPTAPAGSLSRTASAAPTRSWASMCSATAATTTPSPSIPTYQTSFGNFLEVRLSAATTW